MTTYRFTPTMAGTFLWACDLAFGGDANGWAMANPGYMSGYITVTPARGAVARHATLARAPRRTANRRRVRPGWLETLRSSEAALPPAPRAAGTPLSRGPSGPGWRHRVRLIRHACHLCRPHVQRTAKRSARRHVVALVIPVSLSCLDRGSLLSDRSAACDEGSEPTLPDIHRALRTLLAEEGRIDPAEVDVTFDTPTRQWSDRLTRPTISLFLHDVRENTERRDNSYHVAHKDGRSERRRAPRRIDLRYLVSAIATDVDDEHRLLWRALYALMKYPSLPDRVLPDVLRGLDPPLVGQAAQGNGEGRQDLWSALGVEPRAAFGYQLTAPLDLDLVVTAPLVLTRTLRVQRLANGQVVPEIAAEGGRRIGGVVRDGAGQPVAAATVSLEGHSDGGVTDTEGRFALARVPEGAIRVRVVLSDGRAHTATLHVPSAGYEITVS